VRCAIENIIAIVETRADESMSNKRCSAIVKTVFECVGVPSSDSSTTGRICWHVIESERHV